MTTQRFEAAQEEVLARYGVAAESRLVDVPVTGGKAHVLMAGEGSPLIMLNGAGTPAAMLAPLMAELAGHRLYAVDLPGHGLTDFWEDFTDDLRANSVAFVNSILDELGLDRVGLLGNSFGSLMILWTALDSPGRVQCSVHIGCPAVVLGTSAPLPVRMTTTRLGPLIDAISPPSAKQVAFLSRIVHQYPLEPEIADMLLATELMPGFGDTLRGIHRRLVRLRGSQPAMSLAEGDLTRISHPVQLIWGNKDPFGRPAVGERMADALPDAELHVVPGGHAPWLGQAPRVGELVSTFLGNRPLRPVPGRARRATWRCIE